MRVALINVIYGSGSTGRIVETLHREYQALGHESYVFYGRGPLRNDPKVIRTGFLWEAKLWRAINMFTGNIYSGSPLSTVRLKRAIKKLKPDVVHIHCINGNMCDVVSLLKWLKKKQLKVVITHHAMFLFTGGCGLIQCRGFKEMCLYCPHKSELVGRTQFIAPRKIFGRWKKAGLDGPYVRHAFVSPWLESLAKESDILAKGQLTSIYNPVNIDVFQPKGSVPEIGKPYVFFPASLKGATVKGAQFIGKLAQKLGAKGIAVVVTEGSCQRLANVTDIGHINDPEKMAKYYRGALATLVLSSVESFSMPVAESILCGTPVVGFKCGGPETIDTFGQATFVPYGDLDAVVDAIMALPKEKVDCSDQARKVYAPAVIAKQYLTLYGD